MNEILGTIKINVTTTESEVDLNGGEFLISSDIDLYIGTQAAEFYIPAKTIIGRPLCAEKIKVKGSDTGNAYIMFVG